MGQGGLDHSSGSTVVVQEVLVLEIVKLEVLVLSGSSSQIPLKPAVVVMEEVVVSSATR